jgi:cytidyltransferase-like protein
VKVVFEGEHLDVAPGSVVAIGTFDGVHRGHQALLGQARHLAADARIPSVVAMFDRHPATVVRPEAAPGCSRRSTIVSSCWPNWTSTSAS